MMNFHTRFPRQHIRAFWRSELAQSTLLAAARWGIFSFLLTHVCVSMLLPRRMDNPSAQYIVAATRATIPATFYMLYRRQQANIHRRTWIIMIQRLWRMFGVALVALDAGYSQSLAQALATEPLSWRSYLYVTSISSFISLLNAINFPLPFHLQLPIVLLKLTINLVLVVPKINCALSMAVESSHAILNYSAAACNATMGFMEAIARSTSPTLFSTSSTPSATSRTVVCPSSCWRTC